MFIYILCWIEFRILSQGYMIYNIIEIAWQGKSKKVRGFPYKHVP